MLSILVNCIPFMGIIRGLSILRLKIQQPQVTNSQCEVSNFYSVRITSTKLLFMCTYNQHLNVTTVS